MGGDEGVNLVIPGAAKALVRRFYDGFISAGRADVADALLAPDYRYHAPGWS